MDQDFERPNTVSRPELLAGGSDQTFRKMIYDMDHLSHLIQDTRRNISQSFGLTAPEFNAVMGIAVLQEQTGVTVSDLAKHLHVAGPFVTQQANLLVKKGLVQKRPNPNDKRSTMLVLTKEGRALFNDLAPRLCQLNDRIFATLSAEDFAAFSDLLDRVTRGWTQTNLIAEAGAL